MLYQAELPRHGGQFYRRLILDTGYRRCDTTAPPCTSAAPLSPWPAGLLLLSACGGSSPSASNSPAASPSPSKEALITPVDACQLVTATDASDTSTADAVSADQVAAALSGQYGISNAKSIAGIGDKAFEYTATSSGSTHVAIFFKANVVLMILMSPSTDASTVEALARAAVSRL